MKKGFTLIELLAVIVILAIIALIATPVVLNIIEDTKGSATLRSTEFYIDAVEQAIIKENMEKTGTFNPNSCEIKENGNLKCDNVELEISVSGEKPNGGNIEFIDGNVSNLEISFLSGETVIMDENKKLVLE